jgi:hypothetical protein
MAKLQQLPGLQQSLYNVTEKWMHKVEDEMISKMPEASGELKESVEGRIEVGENGYEISFYMATYATYVDKGVNGKNKNYGSPYTFKKMPPTKAFDKWIVAKGIAPRSKDGKFSSREGVKWAIAKSVFNKGIKPHNFTQPVIDAQIENLANLTAEEVWQAIKRKIEE